MRKETRVIAKIANLDKPTRSNTYYSEKCLTEAFNEPVFACANKNHMIPVKLSCSDVIGSATATLTYPNINIDMNLAIDDCEKKIIEQCGITLEGWAEKDHKATATATYYSINNLRLTGFNVVDHSSMSCSIEIAEE